MTERNTILDKLLRDPENDFAAVLHAFRESRQPVWHIDRHVLDTTEAAKTDAGFRVSACAAGLLLLREWSSGRSLELNSGVLLSEPYLLIDDGWLEGGPQAAPPHVYICLATHEDAFSPVQHEDSGEQSRDVPPILASLLTGNETIRRAPGAFEDEPGAWLITLDESS